MYCDWAALTGADAINASAGMIHRPISLQPQDHLGNDVALDLV